MSDDNTNARIQFCDKMDVAILVVDAQTEKVLYANRRVYHDLDLPEGKVLGRPYREVFWKEFHPVYERLLQVCTNGE